VTVFHCTLFIFESSDSFSLHFVLNDVMFSLLHRLMISGRRSVPCMPGIRLVFADVIYRQVTTCEQYMAASVLLNDV
jgi:hypothetical protein